jgi:hypothetical protein
MQIWRRPGLTCPLDYNLCVLCRGHLEIHVGLSQVGPALETGSTRHACSCDLRSKVSWLACLTNRSGLTGLPYWPSDCPAWPACLPDRLPGLPSWSTAWPVLAAFYWPRCMTALLDRHACVVCLSGLWLATCSQPIFALACWPALLARLPCLTGLPAWLACLPACLIDCLACLCGLLLARLHALIRFLP